MNLSLLEKGGAVLALIFASRVWARWRVARRERRALATPLVDRVLLEVLFAPRPEDGDDADLLSEMRDTFLHLNRQAYAEEFWNLHVQLAALYKTLAPASQATLRRALMRLLAANDRWLQLTGAKTSAALGLAEAIPPLRVLLETVDSPRLTSDNSQVAVPAAVDPRFYRELEHALVSLSGPEQGQ